MRSSPVVFLGFLLAVAGAHAAPEDAAGSAEPIDPPILLAHAFAAADSRHFCEALPLFLALDAHRPDPRHLYRAAEVAYAAHDLGEALKLYRTLATRAPGFEKRGLVGARITEIEGLVARGELGSICPELPAFCGDFVVGAGETCDDGNAADGDGCDANCTATGCGNGTVTAGELCDDGNTHNGDGCDANCSPTGCGNGVATGAEECDDGNNQSGDGCDAQCAVTACGNGVVTAGESCDDGDKVGGDGCSAVCQIEPDRAPPESSPLPLALVGGGGGVAVVGLAGVALGFAQLSGRGEVVGRIAVAQSRAGSDPAAALADARTAQAELARIDAGWSGFGFPAAVVGGALVGLGAAVAVAGAVLSTQAGAAAEAL